MSKSERAHGMSDRFWFVQKAFKLFGCRIVRLDEDWQDMEQDFKRISAECMNFTVTSIERMYALYKAVEYVVESEIPGDLVECGVWRGGSCMLMARTLMSLGDTSRKIYMYDTYSGMAEPSDDDVATDGARARVIWEAGVEKDESSEWCFSSPAEVKKNLASTGYPAENMVFVEGKVEDTIPGTAPERISILRLDTDWYESTLHELVHLYPLLENRGVLITDDYGYWEGCRKAVNEYFAENGVSMFLNRVDLNARLGIKCECQDQGS